MPKISDLKKKENMNDIIRHAKDLFVLEGYRTVTIDDICKKGGISKGSFYTYFKSKEELFFEIAKETEGMTQFSNESINTKKKSFEDVSLILWDMIFSEITDDDIVNYRLRLEFWIESYDSEELRAILERKSKKSLEVFKRLLRNYLNKNISEEKMQTWAIFFWAQAEGLMMYYTAHQRIPDVTEIKEIRKIVKNFIDFIAM